MDLTSRPYFFAGAAIGPANWPYFRFIEMSVVNVGLGRADGLIIGGAILRGADVAIGFFKLFLW